MPKPPPPVPVPTIDSAAAKAAQDNEALRKRQGMGSTILSGGSTSNMGGSGTPVQTATSALLGS